MKKNNENEQLHFTGVQFLTYFGIFLDICKNTNLLMLFEYTNKEFMSRGVPGGELCCANSAFLDTRRCWACKLVDDDAIINI